MNIEEIKKKIPLYVTRTGDMLVNNGFEAYLVGGSVRDLLFGKEPDDFDIATNATPDQIQKVFPKTIATGAKFGTIVVVMEDRSGERFNVEVTTYRSESDYVSSRWPSKVEFSKNISEDIERRDFTINSMAINLGTLSEPGANSDEIVLDLFNGKQDLDKRLIRAVGDPVERFSEDALRIMRACRFASQLGFTLDPATEKAIIESRDLLKNISIERIRDEVIKLLYKSPKPSIGFHLMDKTGILDIIIPELSACKGVIQPQFHIDDVFEHTMKVVDCAQDEVKLAALFHDIGKPLTISRDKAGAHFYQHDIVGAKEAEKVMRRMKFPNKDIELIVLLIKHHMFYYPSADWRKYRSKAGEISEDGKLHHENLEALREEGQTQKIIGGWTDAAIRRFINRVGGMDNLNLLIQLRIADATANPKSNFTDYEIKALQERISRVSAQDAAFKTKDLAINGNDLLQIGIPKGPEMGRILNELLEKVIDYPELNTREKLLEIAQIENH